MAEKSEERSRIMRQVKGQDTGPEMQVRRLIHGMGYRYRLHRKDLPGKPDLVFPSRRKIIFVHGCFWHQHDDPACKRSRKPKTNVEYWGPKLEKNKTRDAKNIKSLKKAGWGVLVIWECEIKSIEALSKRITKFFSR